MLELAKSDENPDQPQSKTSKEEKCSTRLLVKERYVELLDLRRINSKSLTCLKENSKELVQKYGKISKQFLSNSKEFSNISGQYLSNTGRKSITTAIIAERIMNKNMEIQRCNRTFGKSETRKSLSIDQINQLIAKRILETEDRIAKENRLLNLKTIKENKETFKKLVQFFTKSNHKDNLRICKSTCVSDTFFTVPNMDDPNRLLQSDKIAEETTNVTDSIITIEQVKIEISKTNSNDKTTIPDIKNITKWDSKHHAETVNVSSKIPVCEHLNNVIISNKNVQTDSPLLVDEETRTDLLHSNNPAKYTNTEDLYYPSRDKSTQLYEYMTKSDLFCLEWINKYLFDVHLNPYNIILDDTIRDLSVIVNKSSLFSSVSRKYDRETN